MVILSLCSPIELVWWILNALQNSGQGRSAFQIHKPHQNHLFASDPDESEVGAVLAP